MSFTRLGIKTDEITQPKLAESFLTHITMTTRRRGPSTLKTALLVGSGNQKVSRIRGNVMNKSSESGVGSLPWWRSLAPFFHLASSKICNNNHVFSNKNDLFGRDDTLEISYTQRKASRPAKRARRFSLHHSLMLTIHKPSRIASVQTNSSARVRRRTVTFVGI